MFLGVVSAIPEATRGEVGGLRGVAVRDDDGGSLGHDLADLSGHDPVAPERIKQFVHAKKRGLLTLARDEDFVPFGDQAEAFERGGGFGRSRAEFCRERSEHDRGAGDFRGVVGDDNFERRTGHELYVINEFLDGLRAHGVVAANRGRSLGLGRLAGFVGAWLVAADAFIDIDLLRDVDLRDGLAVFDERDVGEGVGGEEQCDRGEREGAESGHGRLREMD